MVGQRHFQMMQELSLSDIKSLLFRLKFSGSRSGGGGGGGFAGGVDKDEVPHSRLFVVHGSTIGEDDLKKAFKEYGSIENIRVVSRCCSACVVVVVHRAFCHVASMLLSW